MPGQDESALLSFLNYASEADLIGKGTAQSFKSACRTVLGTLDDQEREDILTLDLDDVLRRFAAAPQVPPLSPDTVHTYQQRTRSAVEAFRRYHADPVNWTPGYISRRRPRRRNDATPRNTQPASAIVSTPAAETIVLHFPIRKNHFVRITGIPFDITKNEMTRMTNYLSQLEAVTDEQSEMPASIHAPESILNIRPVPALPMPTVEPAIPVPVTETTPVPTNPATEGNRVLD